MKTVKSKKTVFFTVLCLIILIVIAIVWLLFYLRNQPAAGIRITPSVMYETSGVPCYRQNDPLWAEDRLGQSVFTMGHSGCLTSCIAAALSAQQREDVSFEEITPKKLNSLFTQYDVYNDNGDIVWDQIRLALPKVKVLVAGKPDGQEIEKLIADGKYPIVKVKYHGNGAWHWVLLAGADERGYLCMDPMNQDKELVPLSEHEDVVYSMRTVWLEADTK